MQYRVARPRWGSPRTRRRPSPRSSCRQSPRPRTDRPDRRRTTGRDLARGEIVFDVFRGDGRRLGTTTHRWQHDGGRYAMEAQVETTGLVALFKTVDYVQRSEGRLLPQGLQPETFNVERGGKRREWSEFDWKAGGSGCSRTARRVRPRCRVATRMC